MSSCLSLFIYEMTVSPQGFYNEPLPPYLNQPVCMQNTEALFFMEGIFYRKSVKQGLEKRMIQKKHQSNRDSNWNTEKGYWLYQVQKLAGVQEDISLFLSLFREGSGWGTREGNCRLCQLPRIELLLLLSRK